jgi:hypothetical protein
VRRNPGAEKLKMEKGVSISRHVEAALLPLTSSHRRRKPIPDERSNPLNLPSFLTDLRSSLIKACIRQ